MLSWFTGATTSTNEQGGRADDSVIEQPDTPAHVFITNAFKHTLWGTPRYVTRSVSGTSQTDDKQPSLQTSSKLDHSILLSPSKRGGILLTPGTSSGRRTKSVTFRSGTSPVESRDISDPLQPKTPNVGPGGFPARDQNSIAPSPGKTMPSYRHVLSQTVQPLVASDGAPMASENTNKDAFDWKTYHEEYARRTQNELKLLLAKQQAAKQFARDKNDSVHELTGQLEKANARAALLETKVNDLMDRLRSYAEIAPAARITSQDTARQNRAAKRATGNNVIHVLDRQTRNATIAPSNTVNCQADTPSEHANPLKARDANVGSAKSSSNIASQISHRANRLQQNSPLADNTPMVKRTPSEANVSEHRRRERNMTPEKHDLRASTLTPGRRIETPARSIDPLDLLDRSGHDARQISESRAAQARARIAARRQAKGRLVTAS